MAMPKIEFRCQMFRGDWDQVWSQRRMVFLMEALVRVNQTHLQEFEALQKRGLVKSTYPSVYRSGLHYETEKGTEIWPDIPSLIEGTMGQGLYPGPWGDCLPVTTLVLLDDYTVKPIGNLVPGDRIMGDGEFTTVTEHAITGEKPILAFDLNNGATLRCSPEHRLFLRDGEERRADDIKPGDLLRTPTVPFPTSSILNPSTLSPEDFAWLLGVYVADGWCEIPRSPRFAISGKDGFKKEEQKRRVQSLMEKIGVNTRWHERYIAVNDRPLAEYMATCGGHAPDKHLPSLCFSKEQIVPLIEGLAADTSTASSGTITHGTTSEILALQLRVLYRMLGQSTHIKRWDDHGGLGTHPMYRITVRQADDPAHPNSRRNSARVVGVREEEPELCCDITTDTGRFYLPESDTIVHNCEDLACYRAAELRELPFHYERPSKIRKGKTECADPRFPQEPSAVAADQARKTWPGWKMVKGGILAMPFAKWRRGPEGQYHYHALLLTPEGRLEDPSLVLGMGREKEFSEAGMAEKLKDGTEKVVLQYAKDPEVVIVDPEKPSGYGGGKAKEMDEAVMKRLKEELSKGGSAATATQLSGDARELRAYAGNPLGDLLDKNGVSDLDAVIGWSRKLKQFVPYDAAAELRRLVAYGRR
jgi:hypothetical protein